MKILAIATILMLVVLVACETEDPDEKTSIITGEGSTILVNVSSGENTNEQDEQLDPIEGIVESLTVKHDCIVGKIILLKAKVEGSFDIGLEWGITLDTNDNGRFRVNIHPIRNLIPCDNYYKIGETYVFPVLITLVNIRTFEGKAYVDIDAEIVATEELKEEWKKIDCEND